MTRRYPTENANSTEVGKPWVDDVFPLHPLCRKDLIKIVKVLVAQSCPTLCDPVDPARLLCLWNPPGKNTGVSSPSLLQGTFLTQGSNLGLLHCKQILLPSEPPGKPLIKTQVWVSFYKAGYGRGCGVGAKRVADGRNSAQIHRQYHL